MLFISHEASCKITFYGYIQIKYVNFNKIIKYILLFLDIFIYNISWIA